MLFPALTGVVNVLDKLIIDRFSPTPYIYAFWIGIYELVLGAVAFSIVVGFQGMEGRMLLGGAVTGAVTAVSLLLYLGALKYGQVARVVPIWFLFPLFVAPMAAVTLGERLPGLVAVALVLAVAGGVLVSWQGTSADRAFGNPLVLVLALAAAVVMAMSFVLNKYFLEEGFSWQFFSSFRLGFAPVMLATILLKDVRQMGYTMMNNRGFVQLLVFAEIIITVVIIVRFAAVGLSPDVSSVAAISAIQPALVFFYSLGLAKLAPNIFGNWVTFRTIPPQVAGIAAIALGVVIISVQATS